MAQALTEWEIEIQRTQFGEDVFRGLGPGERFGIGIVLGDVAVDGGLQVDDRVEAAAADAAAGECREEGLAS
jgi:hypothetical protein